MKTETRSSLLMIIAFISGIALGIAYQQRTDEHKLIMAEWKKITSINQVVDLRISNEVDKMRKENNNGKLK